jgi:CheY-like chemotaxis protein
MPNKKILAADDDNDVLVMLYDYFQSRSFDVIVAHNGMEAVNLAKHSKPDVILLDLMMPVMDGYAACDLLKRDKATKDIPIIVLTAKDISKGPNTVINADFVILKPYNLDSILEKVKISLMKTRPDPDK